MIILSSEGGTKMRKSVVKMKITKGKKAGRWNTRITIPAKLAPMLNITEKTLWKPMQTQRILRFRPATAQETGDLWPTQNLRKSQKNYQQYTINIPIAWAKDLDIEQGVSWKVRGSVLWGSIPKKREK
jgi:hypothetical protein